MTGCLLVACLIILPSLLLSQNSEAGPVLQAKKALFLLDLSRAERLLEPQLMRNPGYGYALYYRNYLDFIHNLLGGPGSEYRRYRADASERIEALKRLDNKNPEYLYFLSAVYLQSSLLDFLERETWHGAKNLYLAHRHIRENNAIYPEYPDNQKILGIMELLLSSVPSNKEWLFKVFRMTGDRETGLMRLQWYVNHCDRDDRFEAILIFGMASIYFSSDPVQAFRELSKAHYDGLEGPLYQYVYALAAHKAGKQDEALLMLTRQNPGHDYSCNPFADLLMADILLTRLEAEAGIYYKKFIEQYRGGNFRRMAYHKLSWHYFLQGDDSLYAVNRERAQKLGWDYLEQDKQARSESLDTFDLNHTLLKARVLYDGDRYHDALKILLEMPDSGQSTLKDRIEYPYRLARVYHALEDITRAREYYEVALEKGNDFPFYFASYSALQLAGIYEHGGNYQRAEFYYLYCLDLNLHQYTRSIGSAARDGLKRVQAHSRE
jgi:hypothetical protein